MEKKEAVKVESFVGSPTFSSTTDHVQTSYPFVQGFDFVDDKNSLGFMELLGVQDFSPSLLDMIQVQIPSVHTPNVQVVTEVVESPPEVLNQPATPNSSTISSASSEGLNDEPVNKGADNEAEEQGKTKKESKPKKTNQKRQREPRFAFMTKSEVDHLEDGYRWRKYGQKAVKNSPFPRSYYRCTTASCNVKKRVERSFSDPSVVVTTYEGQHTHPSPVMPRPNFTGSASDSGFSSPAAFAMPMQRTLSLYQQHQSQQHPPFPLVNSFSPLGLSYNGSTANAASYLQQYEKRFYTRPGSALLNDHGLLQDLVPSHMLKEE
ncbi:WRKY TRANSCRIPTION FACTOR [Salix purpurea]|uniref:WRKY transcription factor n=1 Tax=Salix purpurea TaxID=77065 RepID=A0A9Q0SRJ3_SALPP|nr:WRKY TRANSCRIPTION FACTOR [Salix purpurea]